MNEQRFRAVVAWFEPMAKEHPRRYKAVVALLALAGLLAPIPILLALAGLMGVLGWLAFPFNHSSEVMALVITGWVVLGIVGVVVAKSFWSRLPRPDHPRVHPGEAPALFGMLEELQAAFPGVVIHEVQVTPEMNAGIVQRSWFGLPWFRRNYLGVGLPLLYAQTPENFRAVLAHEMAHLSGHASLFPAWINQNRRYWLEWYEVRPKTGNFNLVWHGFMRWYIPLFAAVSYLESRWNEFHADRLAAQVCGRDAVMASLMDVHLKERLLTVYFYPGVLNRSGDEELPPSRFFAEMADFFRKPPDRATVENLLENSLKEETGYNSTHPCLRERLQALCGSGGSKAELLDRAAAPPGPGSAAALLGERGEHFAALFSKNWKAANIGPWRHQHRYMAEQRKRLAELTEKARTETLSPEESWEAVRAEFMLATGPDREQEILRAFIADHPEHAEAHYLLGCRLLALEKEEGIGLLVRAMELHSDYYLVSFERVRDYLSSRGREGELGELKDKARIFYREIDLANKERSALRSKDVLLPHDLSAEKVEAIAKVLSRIDRIREAYLARKEVAHLQDKPCYVLVLKLGGSLLADTQSDSLLCQDLARRFSDVAPVVVMTVDGASSRARKRLRDIPDARIQ